MPINSLRKFAASASAANVMCRSPIAAVFPLFTVQMFDTVSYLLKISAIYFLLICVDSWESIGQGP